LIGTEWIWPIGYYLRSVMKYASQTNKESQVQYIQTYLSKFYTSIRKTDWKGLPELTNENGKDCTFSCPSQAWSIASILEVCYEMANL
jgi:glycogen debranching enzyme